MVLVNVVVLSGVVKVVVVVVDVVGLVNVV